MTINRLNKYATNIKHDPLIHQNETDRIGIVRVSGDLTRGFKQNGIDRALVKYFNKKYRRDCSNFVLNSKFRLLLNTIVNGSQTPSVFNVKIVVIPRVGEVQTVSFAQLKQGQVHFDNLESAENFKDIDPKELMDLLELKLNDSQVRFLENSIPNSWLKLSSSVAN